MKIPTDKRNKLIMVAVATVAVIAALWYLLIAGQTAALREVRSKIQSAHDQQQKMDNSVKLAEKIKADLAAAEEDMTRAEQNMAGGDLYSWMYNMLKEFKSGYRVEIPQFSSVELADCALIYKFPFQQARMNISGSAYYHDLGKFVADFENHFTQMRIQNLDLAPGGGPSDREKLAFRMDIVALVKSSEIKLP